MKWNKIYQYQELLKASFFGKRYYLTQTGKLPSVTTILSYTKEDNEALEKWKKFVGEERAEKEKKQATDLGSILHQRIEDYIKGDDDKNRNKTNYLYMLSYEMSELILQDLKINLSEVWGLEISIFYPNLYAGTIDCVGIYKGQPSIVDFKTAKKIRTKDQIQDYYLQLVAYAEAHNILYGTNIKNGSIIMVSREKEIKTFHLDKNEYYLYKEKWLDRLEKYYIQQGNKNS